MKKLLICGLLQVLAFTCSAKADISLSWSLTEDAGMYKVIGTLTTTGGLIDAIDCGTPSQPGLRGTFYQDWVVGILPTPAMNTVIGDSPEIDTHFLFNTADLTVPAGRELKEDNGGTNPSVGTYLGGTFGLAPSAQAQTLDFVQIYVPLDGSCIYYNIEVSEAGVGKTSFQGCWPDPEPTMPCLIACGSIPLLLARRRRREEKQSP